VRIYTLRQRTAFDAAPYAAFLAPDAERAALGNDLVEVRDMTLVPGQRAESVQALAPDAAWIGVVALFHSPATRAWRLSVAGPDAERNGLALDLGACAMRRAGMGASDTLVRCQ
jgi:type VI secretion system protein VasD